MSELYDRKKREYASQQRPSISSHAANEMWQLMRPWALVVQAAYDEHRQCAKPVCPVCDALRDAYKESDK